MPFWNDKGEKVGIEGRVDVLKEEVEHLLKVNAELEREKAYIKDLIEDPSGILYHFSHGLFYFLDAEGETMLKITELELAKTIEDLQLLLEDNEQS